MNTKRVIKLFLSGLRLVPHIIILKYQQQSEFERDLSRWKHILGLENDGLGLFILLMTQHQEFRNIFYLRYGAKARLFGFLCKPLESLYFSCPNIGTGLFIQHGFATIVTAKSIGENCWINQQVTIGYSNTNECPTIESNVTIGAGAIVIGNVHIGQGAIIGAGAVVVKDVPSHCTVVGNPAYVVKRNNLKLKMPL